MPPALKSIRSGLMLSRLYRDREGAATYLPDKPFLISEQPLAALVPASLSMAGFVAGHYSAVCCVIGIPVTSA